MQIKSNKRLKTEEIWDYTTECDICKQIIKMGAWERNEIEIFLKLEIITRNLMIELPMK